MKKTITSVATITIIAAAALFNLSNVKGPATISNLNRTGTNGTTTDCSGSGCHSNISATTILNVGLQDVRGKIVTGYYPDSVFIITYRGTNQDQSLSHYGLQLSTVQASTQTQAGFVNSSLSQKTIKIIKGLEIYETTDTIGISWIVSYHSITPTQYIRWATPPKGTGDVNICMTLLYCNGDGTPNGDISINRCITVKELQLSNSIDETNKTEPTLQIFPNPCSSSLSINFKDFQSGKHTIIVRNSLSSVVYKETIRVDVNKPYNINTSKWNSGLYFVTVSNNKIQQTTSVVKR